MITLLFSFFAGLLLSMQPAPQTSPNIIFILTDDMGFGDVSSFHGKYQTPQIDKMAAGGLRLKNYYSSAPVCSPSRVGFLTGTAPAKWRITNYLSDRQHNRNCEQNDFLDPAAPSIARVLKQQGYATAHFGKWHMGGGRDVKNAPPISAYGFDEWSSTWESPDPDPRLTSSNWIWANTDSVKRWHRTAWFVDKTIDFLKRNTGKPCFINLWPDDVHTPWVPGEEFVKGEGEKAANFLPVLKEYDKQIGRLLDSLRLLGLDKNTLVIFTSDNGPAPHFNHARTAGLRGAKVSLYEGGIRMPFIAWGAGVPAGRIDSTSLVTATDLFPSFAELAGIRKKSAGDGEDKSAVLYGKPADRKKDIYWEYGRNNISFGYPKNTDRSPSLAIRSGRWKLLMNPDGSSIELYDILTDHNENANLAEVEPKTVATMKHKLLEWWQNVPH